MSKDTSSFTKFCNELNGTLDLIENNVVGISETAVKSKVETENLLSSCAEIAEKVRHKKPIMRVIHHFACSGGTLFSKCLAAMPNLYLLSELHPTTRHGIDWREAKYTPRDTITQAMFADIPEVDELAEKIFVEDIKQVEKHLHRLGGNVVIRAHSHADFCMSTNIPKVDTVTKLLEPHFELKQLVTVRNPIDSFASLRQNNWVHFSPNTFDEYCRRLKAFLGGFSKNEIVTYEELVKSPKVAIMRCSELLDTSYSDDIFEYLDIFKISGDSGRKGTSINQRERKKIDESYKREIESSNNFKYLCDEYEFKPDL